jgi:hypothetical protein
MSVSVTFFSLISELIDQSNQGIAQAVEASSDQPLMFIAPKIEIQLRCLITNNEDSIEVTPSNGETSNYYGVTGDSLVSLVFKLKQ